MTDEQTDTESRTMDELTTTLDRSITELTVDELIALKEELKKRGVTLYNSLWASPEMVALLGAAAIYSKAFLETLAKRHADGVADLVGKQFRKNGKTAEVEIGVDGGSVATIAVTADMPDEARLALLDLDVTANDLRGKVLRWNSSASAWRPDPDE
jgi:hypothetical protein